MTIALTESSPSSWTASWKPTASWRSFVRRTRTVPDAGSTKRPGSRISTTVPETTSGTTRQEPAARSNSSMSGRLGSATPGAGTGVAAGATSGGSGSTPPPEPPPSIGFVPTWPMLTPSARRVAVSVPETGIGPVGERDRSAADRQVEGILVEELGLCLDDRRAHEVRREADRPACREAERQVVERLAGGPRLGAGDLDREEARLAPGEEDRGRPREASRRSRTRGRRSARRRAGGGRCREGSRPSGARPG